MKQQSTTTTTPIAPLHASPHGHMMTCVEVDIALRRERARVEKLQSEIYRMKHSLKNKQDEK